MAGGCWTWRLYWHSGFGGSHTAETDDPVAFIAELRRGGHLDGVEIFGAYRRAVPVESPPPAVASLDVVAALDWGRAQL